MKGVIVSTSFFIVFIACFFFLSWSNVYNVARMKNIQTLKRALNVSALQLSKNSEITPEHIVETIEKEYIINSNPNSNYQIEILGFNQNPILLRARVLVDEKIGFIQSQYELEEIIIEEELKNE